jgi:type VI secretion system protein VasG
LKVFPPALLGRLVTIPYYPLSDRMLGDIARLQLDRVAARVRGNHGIELCYDDAVVALVTSRCTELESGGRMIDAVLTNTVLPTVSQELLRRMVEGNPVRRVSLTATGSEFTYQFD